MSTAHSKNFPEIRAIPPSHSGISTDVQEYLFLTELEERMADWLVDNTEDSFEEEVFIDWLRGEVVERQDTLRRGK